ncbi:MAG TPA: YbaK/EbsC family protein [Thermoanaerobaculia bacterium]|nr:YbaK/EbsC family protein [Thermoanaerobaculia bacterium]
MPVQTIREYLDENHVAYSVVKHAPAFTAQETAATAHVPGREMAKAVIVKVDGRLVMTVLPASRMLDVDHFRAVTRAKKMQLATEEECARRCRGTEVGAMPPFGNLYKMETWVDETLSDDEEIAFNAGTHTELIRMRFSDFERLVRPRVHPFSLARGDVRGRS